MGKVLNARPLTQAQLDRRARIAWLRAFPQTWEPYEFGPRSDSKRILFQMMQQCGLYGRKVNWFDTGLDRLVEKLRSRRA